MNKFNSYAPCQPVPNGISGYGYPSISTPDSNLQLDMCAKKANIVMGVQSGSPKTYTYDITLNSDNSLTFGGDKWCLNAQGDGKLWGENQNIGYVLDTKSITKCSGPIPPEPEPLPSSPSTRSPSMIAFQKCLSTGLTSNNVLNGICSDPNASDQVATCMTNYASSKYGSDLSNLVQSCQGNNNSPSPAQDDINSFMICNCIPNICHQSMPSTCKTPGRSNSSRSPIGDMFNSITIMIAIGVVVIIALIFFFIYRKKTMTYYY